MLKRLPKVFLVATSIAPISITLAFVSVRSGNYVECLFWLLVAGGLVLATKGILYLSQTRLEVLSVTLSKAKTSDREVIGFLLAYVVPLALGAGQIPQIDKWAVGFLVLFFGAVVWGTQAYDFNPLLGLIGYHFFEIELQSGITYVLITKRSIVSVQQVTAVVQLTEYVLLDRE